MDIEELLAQLEAPEEPERFEIVNGAMRSIAGTFWQLPERRFRTDGREQLSRDRLNVLIDRAVAFMNVVRSGDTVNALAAARALRTCTDLIEHEMVAIARSHHWAWAIIGRVLGLHPSTVHRRFARTEAPIRERRPPPVPEG